MITPTYNVDYFINKFSAISEDLWTIYTQHDGFGRHCAFGWCRTKDTLPLSNICANSGSETIEGRALIQLFKLLFNNCVYGRVAEINNGDHPEYQQPTPKQRILAALQDIKKLQEPKVKEVIRYVAVSESLKKQALTPCIN